MFTLRQTVGVLAMLAAPLAHAIPVAVNPTSTPASGMQISQLAITQPAANSTQDTTLSFVVADGNATTLCSGEWASNGTYPTGGYTPCANSSFKWNFEDGSFTSASQFTLQIEYTYEDDAVGQYPYNQMTEFARANVTQEHLTCSTTQKGAHACQQHPKDTFRGVIWASIAK